MWLSLLKIKKNTVYVSGLTVRYDKYERKEKEVNVILKKKCNDKNLSFIDNGNIDPLNKSGLHLNEYCTTQLLITFVTIWKSGGTESVWTTILEEKEIM